VNSYVVRTAGPEDLGGFKMLRDLAGPGFTSLMLDDKALADRLDYTRACFASTVETPGSERYMLALEHRDSGAVVGCCQVKATIGASPPFFNFRVLRVAQASAAAQRRFDMDVLILVNEFTGSSEVGSLFLHPEHRAPGVGKALAQARYMLMAAAPHRYIDRVVSELRGVVDADGVSPFWEAIGRHFFKMDFADADMLSARTANQFILDLMPKYPIYVDLLPAEARAVIGRCHPSGVAARRMLDNEGFRFDNVVDIFDGGPLVSASRDSIRTVREARRAVLRIGAALSSKRGLLARAEAATFRCTPARIDLDGDAATVSGETAQALGLEDGAHVLAWVEQ